MQQTDQDEVICLTCKDSFKYCGSTTSNLIKHLRTRHPLEYAELREENDADNVTKQPKINIQPTLIDTIAN